MTDAVPKARRATYFIPAAQPIQSFGSVDFTELSPDTEPAVIAARHREEVSDAYHIRGIETAAEIGEALMLPVPIVQRHLESLGVVEPLPAPADAMRLKRGESFDRVRSCLEKAKAPLLTKQVVAQAGVSYQSAIYTLKSRPDLFEATVAGYFRRAPVYAWTLKGKEAERT